jgi:hypothetical protein
MFPFESDFNKYKQITEDEATRRLSLISGAGFCYTTPTGSLPQSLQRVNNLVGGFVSGFAPEAQSPIGSGTPLEATFTVRYDVKDAPFTGNLYAYLILQVGTGYYMSPPCTKLGTIPHHFSGVIPLNTTS